MQKKNYTSLDLTKANLVTYSKELKKEILQLMSFVPYKDLIWQWQFEENPYKLPFKPIVINHAEKIIGFNGEIRMDIIYEGKVIDAIWSCDFFVHKDYRGQGIGGYMKKIQFNSNNLVMAFGLSESAVSVWKNRSCLPNEEICALRKYRNINNIKRFSWFLYQFFEYLRGWPIRVHDKSYQYKILATLGEKSDVDNLWESIRDSYKKIVVRNYNYLYWRYEKHPLTKYQFIQMFNNGKLEAIGVFRKHKNNSYFVDMIAHSSNTHVRSMLISKWLKLHANSQIYHCVSTDQLLQKCLLAYGFHKTYEKQWFFVHSKNKDDLTPEKNWFIMSGDSDGEFLKAANDSYKKI